MSRFFSCKNEQLSSNNTKEKKIESFFEIINKNIKSNSILLTKFFDIKRHVFRRI